MKTLGKAAKINVSSKGGEAKMINEALTSYRQTPHPKTGIAPNDRLFRDGVRSSFPRKKVSNQDIAKAKNKDLEKKIATEEVVNSSKYRKRSHFDVGDLVFVRNFNKKSKYDPIFLKIHSG